MKNSEKLENIIKFLMEAEGDSNEESLFKDLQEKIDKLITTCVPLKDVIKDVGNIDIEPGKLDTIVKNLQEGEKLKKEITDTIDKSIEEEAYSKYKEIYEKIKNDSGDDILKFAYLIKAFNDKKFENKEEDKPFEFKGKLADYIDQFEKPSDEQLKNKVIIVLKSGENAVEIKENSKDNFIKFMTDNKDDYTAWVEKNKETKKELIEYIGTIVKSEQKDGEEVKVTPPEELKKMQDTLTSMTDKLKEHIGKDDMLKVIATYSDTSNNMYEQIKKWIEKEKNEEVKNSFMEKENALGDIKTQIIPTIWVGNNLFKNEAYRQNLLLKLLLETLSMDSLEKATQYPNGVDNWIKAHEKELEKLKKSKPDEYQKYADKIKELKPDGDKEEKGVEIPNELKKKAAELLGDGLTDLINIAKIDDFKKAYENWIKAIAEVKAGIDKINENVIKELAKDYDSADPIIKSGYCCQAIQKLSNPPKENSSFEPMKNEPVLKEFQTYIKKSIE